MKTQEFIDNIKERIAILEIDVNDEEIPTEIRDEMKNELKILKKMLS